MHYAEGDIDLRSAEHIPNQEASRRIKSRGESTGAVMLLNVVLIPALLMAAPYVVNIPTFQTKTL